MAALTIVALAVVMMPGVAWADLDCADIGRQVNVGSYDPNGFDADGDGIGCETYGTGGSYVPQRYQSTPRQDSDTNWWPWMIAGGAVLWGLSKVDSH